MTNSQINSHSHPMSLLSRLDVLKSPNHPAWKKDKMNPYYVMLLICIQSSHCNSSEVNITVYAESMPEKVTHKFLTSPLAAYQTCRTLKTEHVKGISSLYLVLSQKHSFHFPHCGSWQNTPVLSGIYQNPAQN